MGEGDKQAAGDKISTQLGDWPQTGDESYFPDLKVGEAWGESITKRRASQLEALLQAWEQEAEHGTWTRPFASVRLTGSDVFWLAARTLSGTSEAQAVGKQVEWLCQADVQLSVEQFFAKDLLDGLHLEGADLTGAHLEHAMLGRAHLDRAFLTGAHLEHAVLGRAHLENAFLTGAHLEHAMLYWTHLEHAKLGEAHLEHAVLAGAHLDRADLRKAHLEGANFIDAHLEGADLSRAQLDDTTNLEQATMDDTPGILGALVRRLLRHRPPVGPISLADMRWNGASLTVADWSSLRRLGDEKGVYSPWPRFRDELERATRAIVQLAKQLRDAGLSDDADRFAYRAQVFQRKIQLRRFRLGRWLFSWLLFIIAGYGYRPLRTLFWYLAVIGAFAFAYFQATHGTLTFGLSRSQVQPLAWYEALVLSVSSFHGRGFFQPVQSLGDPVAILAAIEAVFGLFIEASFIATFTQRYFGK